MRIMHVNKFLYRRGGAESYMLDLAAYQRAQGHEVSFFAMEHPENLADPNEDTFPSRMELNPPPEGLLARAKVAQQVFYRGDARAGMNTILDRERPDVVHLHNIYHQLSPSILRPLAERGIAAVMTAHDYKLVCPTYQLLDNGQICEACLPGKFREAVKRRCNGGSLSGSVLSALELRVHTSIDAYGPIGAFLCPSDFMRQKLHQGNMHRDRLVHVPNFCDVSEVRTATSPGRGVLFAGRLSPEKGADILVRAAPHLSADLPVVIAGDGPDRTMLEDLAAELGVSERIDFLGRIPMLDLHERMREAAVVVVPSRLHENQPMSLLEAYGCGRPVVVSALGGLTEQVVEGETGALVPHEDPLALARAITDIAEDPEHAHRLGLAARARAEELYAIDDHARRVHDVYARVMAGQSVSGA